MRKSLWIMLAVLFLAIEAPNAHADSTIDGTITFTLTGGSPNVAADTASFVYDSNTSSFTSFIVTWNGPSYDFAATGITLADLGSSGNWCAAGSGSFSSCATPGDFDLAGVQATPNLFIGFADPTLVANGTYSVAETVVGAPEPSSVALMLLGVGFVLVLRKRNSRGHQLAA